MNFSKALLSLLVVAISANQANALTFFQKINPIRIIAQIIVNRVLPVDTFCGEMESLIEDAAEMGDDFVTCTCDVEVETKAILFISGTGTASCNLNPKDLCFGEGDDQICAESAGFVAQVGASLRNQITVEQLTATIVPKDDKFPKITISGSGDVSINPPSVTIDTCSVNVEGYEGKCTCKTDGCPNVGEVSYDCSELTIEGVKGPKSDGCVSLAGI